MQWCLWDVAPEPFRRRHARPSWRDRPDSYELARAMSDAWVAIARDDDPNHGSFPKWPAYSVPERATMILMASAVSKLIPDPLAPRP